jgi:hypothetical protein
MEAGAFIAERSFDDDERRDSGGGSDAPGGGEIDQQLAATRHEFLCDEHGEWRAHGERDDADFAIGEFEAVQRGVVGGPSRVLRCVAIPLDVACEIAVGVEDADGGYDDFGKLAAPASLAQETRGGEDGSFSVSFVIEQGRQLVSARCCLMSWIARWHSG